MAEYGPHYFVKAEGWAVTFVFLGASILTGGLAYGDGIIQVLLTIVGVAVFVAAIYIGFTAKPSRETKS